MSVLICQTEFKEAGHTYNHAFLDIYHGHVSWPMNCKHVDPLFGGCRVFFRCLQY